MYMRPGLTRPFVLPVALICLIAARSTGQIQVQEDGRALDAPGSANSLNVPNDAFLTNPLAPSVAGQISSPFRFDPFSVSTNLPSLSAEIDLTNPVFVPGTNYNPATNSDFGLQGVVLPAPVLAPFGYAGSGASGALPQPTFSALPLSGRIPTLSDVYDLPDTLSTQPLGGSVRNPFDLSATSNLFTAPRTSLTTTIVSDPLFNSVDNALGNLDEILNTSAYEEEIIGAPSRFGTRPAAPGTFQFSANRYVRTTPNRGGLIDTNFGFKPSSGVTGEEVNTRLSAEERASLESDFRPPSARTPDMTDPGLDVTALDRTRGPFTDETTGVGQRELFTTSFPEHTLLQDTLREAQRTNTPDVGSEPAGLDDFGLGGPAERAPGLTTGTAPALSGGQTVYDRMKQSIEYITRLRGESPDMSAIDQKPPILADAYQHALAFVRGTEAQPLSSLVGDGVNPGEQFAQKAEQYLKSGEYYRALTSYEVALVSDRDNPLLFLGQGHALIGTGEYYQAVRQIAKAIANFPEIAYFKLDLHQFITDPDLLDIRRADLEKRLAERDDYRLRFLLGYIEYYIGLEEYGLTNLKAAAEAAPDDSPIAAFPEMLETGDALRLAGPKTDTAP